MKYTLCIILFFSLCIHVYSQSWVQLPDFPGTERDDGASFVINNKAYCLSGLEVGWQCTANGFVFDASAETWTGMAPLPVGKERQYATGFSYNNKGYILGGLNCSSTALKDVWQYNPVNNTWLSLPDFPGAGRQGTSNFIIKNKVYVIGGRLSDGTTLNEVWEYNFDNSIWTQKNNLPISGMWRGSAFSIDTIGYICFGMTNSNSFNHYIFKYNYVSDSWSKISNNTLPAQNYIATAVCNNKACLYGGQDSLNNITNNFIVFNPADSSLLNYAGIPTVGIKGGMAFSINNVFYATTGVSANIARVKETWKNVNHVSVNEHETVNQEIRIFPNPAGSFLNIDYEYADASITKMEIVSVTGQILYQTPFNQSVDISELPNGIYFLKVISKSLVVNAKFIVYR